MTPESERMTDLILAAYQKCKDNGHRMDWRRYSNYLADAECINCKREAKINIGGSGAYRKPISGTALTTNCTKKGKL